eukprot:CFRG4380T1
MSSEHEQVAAPRPQETDNNQTKSYKWSVLRTALLVNAAVIGSYVYEYHYHGQAFFEKMGLWEVLQGSEADECNWRQNNGMVDPYDIAVWLGRAVNLQLGFSILILLLGAFTADNVARRWISCIAIFCIFATARFMYTTVIAGAFVENGRKLGPVVDRLQDVAKSIIMFGFFNIGPFVYDIFMERLEKSKEKYGEGMILFMKGDRLARAEKQQSEAFENSKCITSRTKVEPIAEKSSEEKKDD